MRGKAPQGLPHGADFRITPAYAGKSLTAVLLIHGGRDHPRLCGEKACMCAIGGVTAGSPPPMRGKAWVRGTSNNRKGITPAYAGKREWKRNCTSASWDHPRLCGEKHMEVYAICDITGSPPPMRGKVCKMIFCELLNRITPAYAGKSLAAFLSALAV